MATYKAIKGLEIQIQSSDPSTLSTGQVWYNTTSQTVKVAGAGAWSSGGNLLTATSYCQGLGPAGTQSAMLSASTYPPVTAICQLYDGSTWATTTSMLNGRYSASAGGTTTSAIMAGSGYPSSPSTTITEEFNGTTWSEVTNIPVNHVYGTFAGPQTNFFAAGGDSGATTQNYNGTTWTESGNMTRPATAGINSGMGDNTAGLATGGDSAATTTESYDGSSWSAGGALNTGRTYTTGAGPSITGIAFGGYGPGTTRSTKTEQYDGEAWTEIADMTTGRSGAAGGGIPTAAIVFGGETPATTTATEEFNDPSITTVTTST